MSDPSSSLPTHISPEVIEELLGALVTLTPEGSILSWDQRAETLTGFSAAEALHRSLLDLIIPADSTAHVAEQLENALASGVALFEIDIRRKDGGEVFTTCAVRAISAPRADEASGDRKST